MLFEPQPTKEKEKKQNSQPRKKREGRNNQETTVQFWLKHKETPSTYLSDRVQGGRHCRHRAHPGRHIASQDYPPNFQSRARSAPKETHLVCEFFLRLSRACLGKVVVLIYKMASQKRRRFFTITARFQKLVPAQACSVQNIAQNLGDYYSIRSTAYRPQCCFPMFVPTLSW